MSRISAAAECLPESSGHFLAADVSPAKLNVSFIADFIQNDWLVVLLTPLVYQLGGTVGFGSLDTAVSYPWQVIVVVSFAVMDGSQVVIWIFFADDCGISFPVCESFLMHQIVLIGQ